MRSLTSTIATMLCALVFITFNFGCEPYRVEYRRIPKYYAQAMPSGVPDKVVLEDGTTIIYLVGDEQIEGAEHREAVKNPFKPREEHADGSVTLRALLPEHVIQNTLTCVQKGEYDILWEQLVSERTKLAYAERDIGFAEFEAFFMKYQRDLASTLNRMMHEFSHNGVVVENLGQGVIQCRLHPMVTRDMGFKFHAVLINTEGMGMTLQVIK